MNFGGSGITEPLFQWIRSHLPNGKHILELGSGDVSTQHLSLYYRMTSVEDDFFYVNRHPRSTYIHAPLVDGWYDREILKAKLPQDYDIILVDGPTGSVNRCRFMSNLDLFREDVPIIFDDTWRVPERHMAKVIAFKRTLWLEDYQDFMVVLPENWQTSH